MVVFFLNKISKSVPLGSFLLLAFAVAYWTFFTTKELSPLSAIQAHFAHEQRLDGQGVTIAVIDEGFDSSHGLIKERLSSNRFNTDTQRQDISESMIFDGQNFQFDDHGTHVVGIIASNDSNISIAPKAEIIPIKVGLFGGDQAFVKALKHAALTNAQIVNISLKLGHGQTISPNVRNAIIDLAQTGKILVIAAGNEGIPMEASLYTHKLMQLAQDREARGRIILVGALSYKNGREMLAEFSNYPGSLQSPQIIPFITAPGDNILSATTHTSLRTKKSGTSMAAPMVTGSLAILSQKFPTLAPEDLVALLLNTARRYSLAGERLDPALYGQGIVDLKTALTQGTS